MCLIDASCMRGYLDVTRRHRARLLLMHLQIGAALESGLRGSDALRHIEAFTECTSMDWTIKRALRSVRSAVWPMVLERGKRVQCRNDSTYRKLDSPCCQVSSEPSAA